MEASVVAFRNAQASPNIVDRVRNKISGILASCACFSKTPSQYRKRPGRRPPGGKQRPTHDDRIRTSAIDGGSYTERCIRSDMNKLSAANYNVISRRIRLSLETGNLTFLLTTALEKSYCDPDNRVYIRLFCEAFQTLAGELRSTAVDVALHHFPTEIKIREESLQPIADPSSDYDGFCNSCRVKRRIVGRSSTFAGILDIPVMSRALDVTHRDLYMSHEGVMRDIIQNGRDISPGLDTVGAVEVVVDSIGAMLANRSALISDFRSSVDKMRIESFPSMRCRFKVMDILGR